MSNAVIFWIGFALVIAAGVCLVNAIITMKKLFDRNQINTTAGITWPKIKAAFAAANNPEDLKLVKKIKFCLVGLAICYGCFVLDAAYFAPNIIR